ncbi:MAG: glycosyltransferase family 2 protein [Longimicrobiales bacterium]
MTSQSATVKPSLMRRHVVVVEAFDGQLEFLTDEPAKRAEASGLGLPWPELARLAQCRVTFLVWDDWYRYERRRGSPFTWRTTRPVTRPSPPYIMPVAIPEWQTSFVRRPVPVRDPEHGERLEDRGPGPRSHGLIAGHDPFFWLSVCLRNVLIDLAESDPFAAVLVPVWGGLGYASQLGRACDLHRNLDVPFLLAVTDASVRRQRANQEGEWSQESVVRRQMEDVSLGLADGVIAFGPRGLDTALAGRLNTACVVLAPRRADDAVIAAVDAAIGAPLHGPVQTFMHEPLQAAAGVLAMLDAATMLSHDQAVPALASSGPDCVFAPMHPRTFRDYWSSRGHVRDLMKRGRWTWSAERMPVAGLPLRIHASHFEYLPDVASELARGSAVLLSPAAAEGLCPFAVLPAAATLGAEPEPASLAAALRHILDRGEDWLDAVRRETCAAVVASYRDPSRGRQLEAVADLLVGAIDGTLPVPPVDDVLRLTLDRTRSLAAIAQDASEAEPTPMRPSSRGIAGPTSGRDVAPDSVEPTGRATLSLVITCYELGELVAEAVRSVWAAERVPEEILVIDDGSSDEVTARSLALLDREAGSRGLPLRIVRQENRGLAAARNRGLADAAGEFVSFLDGDDLLEPSFHRLAVPLLERHPGLGGVAAWAFIFGDGVPAGGWFWNPAQAELPALLEQNSVIVPCVMRTSEIRSLGGFAEGQRYNYEDWDLSIRLLAAGRPILTIPEYLMRYRVRGSSLFRTMTPIQNQVMRERMLAAHRTMVSRFAVELVMLTEDRRNRVAQDDGSPSLLQRIVHSIPDLVRGAAGANERRRR